ncbi:MAG: bifunctional adenosylcobinamide kinase/adenosylcobinamide-phosphate guanylyltransferase, partial [Sphingobium sp.]
VPLDLPDAILAHSDGGHVLLVDCLTLWATNLMLGERDAEAATDALCMAIRRFDGHLILVANEVGLGIVPDNALARAFRDVAGRMNQRVAAVAGEVMFIAAGLPLRLK